MLKTSLFSMVFLYGANRPCLFVVISALLILRMMYSAYELIVQYSVCLHFPNTKK